MSYNVKCFKCKEDYKSENKDDTDNEGYCSPCKTEKEAIAKEVDAKFANRPKEPEKKLGIDALPKIKGNVPGGWMIDSRHVL